MNTSKKNLYRLVGLFSLLTFAVYARSLPNAFVNWDDFLLISDNPVSHGLSFQNIIAAFTMFDPELYVPLTFLSFQIDWMLGWGSPFMFHLTNLLLHTANALMVVGLLYVLTKRRDIAIAVGVLFAVHPLNTEAVAWASSRKDLLSTFFFLPSLILYLLYKEKDSQNFYYGSVVCFFLALLAKVSVITLPLVLLLLDWRNKRSITLKTLRDMAPYIALAMLFGFIAILGKPSSTVFPWIKIFIAFKSTLFYLTKIFWPTELSVLYPYTAPISFFIPNIYWSVVAVLVLTAVSFLTLLKTREVFFVWVLYLLTLAPSFSNILKAGGKQLDVYFASDRYAYIPMIAILYLAVVGVYWILNIGVRVSGVGRRVVVITLFGVVSVIFSVLTYKQSLVWKDTGSLFLNVLEHYPNAQVAHNNIGALLYRNGEMDAAIVEFRQSLSIRPTETAFFNLGRTYMAKGMEEEAVEAYQASLTVNPHYTDTLVNFGVYLMDRGELEYATELFERAVSVNEDATINLVLYNLGLVYQKQGRHSDALKSFQTLLERDPKDQEAQEWVEELSS